jgi:hypothetical protein
MSRFDETERLTDEAARRLLVRASELDAARPPQISVAELRDVAREAGIRPSAFEEALAELRDGAKPAVAEPTPVPRKRTRAFWIAAAAPGWLVGALVVAALLVRLLDL